MVVLPRSLHSQLSQINVRNHSEEIFRTLGLIKFDTLVSIITIHSAFWKAIASRNWITILPSEPTTGSRVVSLRVTGRIRSIRKLREVHTVTPGPNRGNTLKCLPFPESQLD